MTKPLKKKPKKAPPHTFGKNAKAGVSPARRPGRPTLFNAKLVQEICDRLAVGQNLVEICDDKHMPDRLTVANWLMRGYADQLDNKPTPHREFINMYTRAREVGSEMMLDEIKSISDNGRNDWMEKETRNGTIQVVNHEHVSRSKLRVDARELMAARMHPRKYAPTQKIAGADGGSFVVEVVNFAQAEGK